MNRSPCSFKRKWGTWPPLFCVKKIAEGRTASRASNPPSPYHYYYHYRYHLSTNRPNNFTREKAMGSEIQYHFLGPPGSAQIVENESNSQRRTNISRRSLPKVVWVLFLQGCNIFRDTKLIWRESTRNLLCPITPCSPLVNPIWWIVVNEGGGGVGYKELNLYFSGGTKYKGRASNCSFGVKKFRSEGEVGFCNVILEVEGWQLATHHCILAPQLKAKRLTPKGNTDDVKAPHNEVSTTPQGHRTNTDP